MRVLLLTMFLALGADHAGAQSAGTPDAPPKAPGAGLEAHHFRAFNPVHARERSQVWAHCSREFHNPESAAWTRREVSACMERAGYSYDPCR